MNSKKSFAKMIVVLIILGVVFYLSYVELNSFNRFPQDSLACDTNGKIDSLITIIVNKPYIYMSSDYGQRKDIDYLVTNLLVRENVEYDYNQLVKRRILTINTNRIDTLDADVIHLDSIYNSENFHKINLRVLYYIAGKRRSTTTKFSFEYNDSNCSWILKDSILKVH